MIEGTEISRHGIPLAQLNYQIVLTKYIDGSIHHETTQQDKRSKATTAKAYSNNTKVKNAPIRETGIMSTTTQACQRDSKTTEQMKNIKTATTKRSQ